MKTILDFLRPYERDKVSKREIRDNILCAICLAIMVLIYNLVLAAGINISENVLQVIKIVLNAISIVVCINGVMLLYRLKKEK